MADTTIESLQLEIQAPSNEAANSIDKLTTTLGKLKSATKGLGLTGVSNQIKGLNTALQGVDASSADKLDKISNSLSKLSGLGQLKISSSIGNQLKNIGTAATSLNGVDFSGIGKMATALQPLSTLGKSNLTSFITQLDKLPQLAQTLNSMNMAQFTSQIQQLSNALAPLASQLNTVSTAFQRLPANIRSTVTATNTMARANNTASKSYINLWAKLRMAKAAVMTIGTTIASWITRSNIYIESLNVFNAALGKYADEAMEYANKVEAALGIDPGDFLKNWGVFMTIIDGFGVASDRAYIMSKNLTQLAYDINSFYGEAMGVTLEDAMQKLTSGISGELEPLRRLGYDLSVARLQQEALNLGIDKSVQSMTQAEKAELRYYAMLTQVTVAHGDFARTLSAPANQIRILKAQVAQVSRALGNLFIPVLNVTLPYLIAFAKVLKEVINLIGTFVGFTLPEVKYEGISAGSSAVDDLTDSENGATKAAKKLKNALLGIDELNVLSQDDSSSGSGSGSGIVTGSDLGFELPEYDFLDNAITSKVEELVKKFKEWAGLTDDIDTWAEFFHTKLGRILATIGAIAIGFATWKISQSVLNGIAGLMALKKAGLGKPLLISVGLSLLAGSVALFIDSIRDALQLGLNEMNFTQMLVSALGLTGGGAILGKALIKPMTILGKTLTGSLIGGAIGAIAGGVTLFVTGIWLALKDGIDWLIASLITAGGALAGAGIGALIGSVGGPLGAAIGALVGIVVSGIIAIVQNWDSVSAWFSKKWGELTGWWNNTAVPWFKGLPEWFKGVLENIGKWFSELPGKIGYALGFALGKVVQWTTDTYAKLKEKIPQIIESVGKWFSELPGKIYKAISDTVNKIGKWCSDVIAKVKQEVPKIIEKIVEFFKGLPDKLKQLGTDIWQGLIDGLTNAWESLKKAVKDFVDNFVQGFKDALGIASPSKVFKEIGGFVIEGFKKGIELFTGIASTVKEWAGSVVEWFTKGKDGKGIVENFKETAGNIVSGFKDKIGSTYTTVKSNVTTWASNVKDWFSSSSFGGINSTSFSTFANNTIEGFKTKIGTAYTNTKSNITTWASNVKSWFSDIASHSAFSGFATNVIDGFKSRIGNYYTTAKSNMTTFADSVKGWFEKPDGKSTLVSKFVDIGKNIIQGFIDGVNSLWDKAMNIIKNFGASIISSGKKGTEEHSPSKAFKQIGAFVIEGFNIGIKDMMGSSFKLMNEWADGIKMFSPTLAMAVDTSAIESFNPTKFADSVSASISTNNKMVVEDDIEIAMDNALERYYQRHLSKMAEDIRRQADKQEQTIVQVGDRTVTDAVVRQQSANGYKFITT